MGNSIFLAQALGIFLFILSLWLLSRNKQFRVIAYEFVDSQALMVLAGLFTLTIGILIILTHNIWHADWTVVITIIGWLIFIQGIIRLFLYNRIKPVANWVLNHRPFLMVIGVIWLGVSIFLLYHGFYAA